MKFFFTFWLATNGLLSLIYLFFLIVYIGSELHGYNNPLDERKRTRRLMVVVTLIMAVFWGLWGISGYLTGYLEWFSSFLCEFLCNGLCSGA